jgi:hypothetical protein
VAAARAGTPAPLHAHALSHVSAEQGRASEEPHPPIHWTLTPPHAQQVIALLRLRNTLVPDAYHEVVFVRFLQHATYVRVANGTHEPGSVVPGRGFAVRRQRDVTPLTMTPVVWEELAVASMTTGAQQRVHNLEPKYGLVDVTSIEGEVFLLPNHTMPPGHFLIFDLNQPPSEESLGGGILPPSWM